MANLTKPQFIAALLPHVQRVRREGSPMFPSVRLAQNLLETGGVLHPWNNLGGIKVGSGIPNAFWKGQWVRKGTWEVENGTRVDTAANFRAYESVYHFYKDQDLLFALVRYARVRAAKSPAEQADALRMCGYATDPQYATKITSIIKTYKLDQYDKEDEYMMDPKDANYIIDKHIRPMRAAALKAGDQKQADESHRLANELRKASGQKVQ